MSNNLMNCKISILIEYYPTKMFVIILNNTTKLQLSYK